MLTSISGVSFEEAKASRAPVTLRGMQLYVLGRDALLKNKRATGRAKDLTDADWLERGRKSLCCGHSHVKRTATILAAFPLATHSPDEGAAMPSDGAPSWQTLPALAAVRR